MKGRERQRDSGCEENDRDKMRQEKGRKDRTCEGAREQYKNENRESGRLRV